MTEFARAMALNIRARFREQGCFNSSVFRCMDNEIIYLNVLSTLESRRPMKSIRGELCYLRLMPYPKTLPIHSNLLRYIHTEAAIDVLQLKIQELLDWRQSPHLRYLKRV